MWWQLRQKRNFPKTFTKTNIYTEIFIMQYYFLRNGFQTILIFFMVKIHSKGGYYLNLVTISHDEYIPVKSQKNSLYVSDMGITDIFGRHFRLLHDKILV